MKNIIEKIINFICSFFNKKEISEPMEETTEEVIEQPIIENNTEPIMTEEVKKELNLRLERCELADKYTIGHLYINNEYFCDTIEDTDRGLCDEMCEEDIKSKKVYGETAIPRGKYEITMNVKSSKYSNFDKYKWAKLYNGYLPRLLNVKGFDGVLIHVGNSPSDTLGCLLVGEHKKEGRVENSTATFHKLMQNYLLPAKEENIKIKINIIA